MADQAISLTKATFDIDINEDTSLYLHVTYNGTKSSKMCKPVVVNVEKRKPKTPVLTTTSKTDISLGGKINVTSSDFETPDPTEKHMSTEWKISTDPEGLNVVQEFVKNREFDAKTLTATELWEHFDDIPASFWTNGASADGTIPDFKLTSTTIDFQIIAEDTMNQKAIYAEGLDLGNGFSFNNSVHYDTTMVKYGSGVVVYRSTPKPESLSKFQKSTIARIMFTAYYGDYYGGNKSGTNSFPESGYSDAVVYLDSLHCVMVRFEPGGIVTWAVVSRDTPF